MRRSPILALLALLGSAHAMQLACGVRPQRAALVRAPKTCAMCDVPDAAAGGEPADAPPAAAAPPADERPMTDLGPVPEPPLGLPGPVVVFGGAAILGFMPFLKASLTPAQLPPVQ